MARYIVTAQPRTEKLAELKRRLDDGEISIMQPFGRSLDYSLRNARLRRNDGYAIWEEEDYCSPPLAQERDAVLDHYFGNIETRKVEQGEGWRQISKLPLLWDILPR